MKKHFDRARFLIMAESKAHIPPSLSVNIRETVYRIHVCLDELNLNVVEREDVLSSVDDESSDCECEECRQSKMDPRDDSGKQEGRGIEVEALDMCCVSRSQCMIFGKERDLSLEEQMGGAQLFLPVVAAIPSDRAEAFISAWLPRNSVFIDNAMMESQLGSKSNDNTMAVVNSGFWARHSFGPNEQAAQDEDDTFLGSTVRYKQLDFGSAGCDISGPSIVDGLVVYLTSFGPLSNIKDGFNAVLAIGDKEHIFTKTRFSGTALWRLLGVF
ncbi:hypothetical protein REPUB_Repub02eG0244600 [Reevesia pubescens]